MLRIFTAAVWFVVSCGCGSRGNVELLESRLRQQEQTNAQLHMDLTKSRSESAVARRETENLRRELASHHSDVTLPEHSGAQARLEQIQFHTLMTGLLNQDADAGAKVLNVVLQPLDADGDPVKLNGEMVIELIDLSQPEPDRLIDRWEIPREQSLEHWQRGAVANGFTLQFPVSINTSADELLLHGRLTTIDERQFDTSLAIRLPNPQ